MREKTVSGYIKASEWDWHGDLTSVILESDDEEYGIEDNDLGNELFDYLEREVEITGIIKRQVDGTKTILVTEYVVLDEDEEDIDDYDDEYMEDEEDNLLSFDDETDY